MKHRHDFRYMNETEKTYRFVYCTKCLNKWYDWRIDYDLERFTKDKCKY